MYRIVVGILRGKGCFEDVGLARITLKLNWKKYDLRL